MLKAYESGVLNFISPLKSDLLKFNAVASATFLKERRANIRLSSPDLMDRRHADRNQHRRQMGSAMAALRQFDNLLDFRHEFHATARRGEPL